MQVAANHPSPPTAPARPIPPEPTDPSSPVPTDEALLARFATSRDNEAFARIVGRHFDRVRAAALRISPDPATADDVSQAVFLLLARRAHQLSAVRMWKPTGLVASFLHRATVLTALHLRRTESRRKKHEHLASRPDLSPPHSPTTSPHSPSSPAHIPDLDAAINALRTPERLAILCRYWEGLSVQQTAEKLGITPPAAAKRLTRALSRLRSRLGPTALAGLPVWANIDREPTAHAALNNTLYTSLMPNTTPLTSTAVVTGILLRRFYLLAAIRTAATAAAFLFVVAVPVVASSRYFSSLSATAGLQLPGAPKPFTELAPSDLKDEALVEWLIDRNERALEAYPRMSCDVRATWVSGASAQPLVSLQSWLIEGDHLKVTATNLQVPTGLPDGRTVRMDHRSINIVTPQSRIECLPASEQTTVYHPDADGFYSKAVHNRFQDAGHPWVAVAGGRVTERLRDYYNRRSPEIRWSAERIDEPNGRVTYLIKTTWVHPQGDVIHHRILDPKLSYLMTGSELIVAGKLSQSLRVELATSEKGITYPSRLVRTWHGESQSVQTNEFSRVNFNPEIGPDDFTLASLPLSPETTIGVWTHGSDVSYGLIRDGNEWVRSDTSRGKALLHSRALERDRLQRAATQPSFGGKVP